MQRGVSKHGVSLNVCCDLDHFAQIVPCGIDDADVTTMQRELDVDPTVDEVAERLTVHLDELCRFDSFELAPDVAVSRREHDHELHAGARTPAVQHPKSQQPISLGAAA